MAAAAAPRPRLCLPGDEVPLAAVASDPSALGPGLAWDGTGASVVATTAGVLRQQQGSDGGRLRVDNLTKRYVPRRGDVVLGIVTQRLGESYKLDIRSSSGAFLSCLSFNSATRKSRPNLDVGSLVHARVEAAHPDLDTELSCIDLDSKKAWTTQEMIFGELTGGLHFEVPMSAAQQLLAADCYVLECLGKEFAYEIAVGQNGRVWLNGPTNRNIVILVQAIKRSFGLTDVQVEALVMQMTQTLC